MQVVLDDLRSGERDIDLLVADGDARVRRGTQVRSARASPGREMRDRVVRLVAPGLVRTRRSRLPARLAPALIPLRLRLRRARPGSHPPTGHRRMAAVAASQRRRSRTSAAAATKSKRSFSTAAACSAITESRAARDTQSRAAGGRTATNHHLHRRQ
jgi:hypothetical protein